MKWYAVDWGGAVFPLGDCEDYDSAEIIADENLERQWIFLWTSDEILTIAHGVKQDIENNNIIEREVNND